MLNPITGVLMRREERDAQRPHEIEVEIAMTLLCVKAKGVTKREVCPLHWGCILVVSR